jgi:hypothetical protein
MTMIESIFAADLVREFNKYVESDPENRLREKISFAKRELMLKPLEGKRWDEVEACREEIDNWVRCYGSKRKQDLSKKTIDLAWMWVARAYEFGVVKQIIPHNPFKSLLPKNPVTGSYID